MDWLEVRSKVLDAVKKYKYAVLVIVIGAVLMLLPNFSADHNTQEVDSPTPTEQQPDVAQQLMQILSQVQGAGKVEVMLTVAVGEKTVYQTDADISGGENTSTRTETVIITDSDRAEAGLVLQVNPPTYMGAIVVCQGADRPAVRLAIIEAVSKVTGLGSDRISVLKMK